MQVIKLISLIIQSIFVYFFSLHFPFGKPIIIFDFDKSVGVCHFLKCALFLIKEIYNINSNYNNISFVF